MEEKRQEVKCRPPSCYFDRPHNCQEEPKHDYRYQRLWRPIIAFVYIMICIFDFIVMPVYVESTNKKPDFQEIQYVLELEDPATRIVLLEKMNFGDREWKSLTLTAGGLFHLAFGSIIAGAAITRGLEKRERLRNPRIPNRMVRRNDQRGNRRHEEYETDNRDAPLL